MSCVHHKIQPNNVQLNNKSYNNRSLTQIVTSLYTSGSVGARSRLLFCEGAIIMNIGESEQQANIIAKTCGSKERGTKKITYSFIDAYHSLCLDKKDIISSELEACESLLKRTTDEIRSTRYRI